MAFERYLIKDYLLITYLVIAVYIALSSSHSVFKISTICQHTCLQLYSSY